MMSPDSRLGMALVGGIAVVLGTVVFVVALMTMFTGTDSHAVGDVVRIDTDSEGYVSGSIIWFTDSDHRDYRFSSAHKPSEMHEKVDVQFAARDPEGTARTSADQWSWASIAAGALTAIVVGGVFLFFAERLRRLDRDGPRAARREGKVA